MACPTCSGTMQAISTGERHYWCPRCGTLRESGSHYDDDAVPKLVERCREVAVLTFADVAVDVDHLHRLGILEAIYPPEQRKGGA